MRINSGTIYNPYTNLNSRSSVKDVAPPKFGWGSGMIPTKTEQTRSDEKILNNVIELAKKDAQSGRYSRGGVNGMSKEFLNLCGEYITPHSPDRKGIFAKGIDKIRATPITPTMDTTLTDIIFGKKNINIKTREIYFVEFKDAGELIGSYHQEDGWQHATTSTETARSAEVHSAYIKAWKEELGKQ